MHPDLAALLEAVNAGTTPPCILADWLEERGYEVIADDIRRHSENPDHWRLCCFRKPSTLSAMMRGEYVWKRW